MNPVAIVLTTSGLVTAIATIIATSGKWTKWIAVKIARTSVNHIRKQDIEESSFVGKSMASVEEIVAALKGANEIMESMRQDINRIHADSLRVELLQLIHDSPDKAEIIENVFSNYIKSGGNSYMVQVIEEWRKVYGDEAIRRQIVRKA